MKALESTLERLLRAAAGAPQPVVDPPSPALVARVLAARREALAGGRELALLLGWLRGGFAFACVLAAVVLALNLETVRSQPEDSLNSWNTIARATWMP